MEIVCCRCCGIGAYPALSIAPDATVPKGEAVYCIPCLTTLCGYDPTTPYPDAGGEEDAAAALAGLVCGACYANLPANYADRRFAGGGLVRVCDECEDGLREAQEIMDSTNANDP